MEIKLKTPPGGQSWTGNWLHFSWISTGVTKQRRRSLSCWHHSDVTRMAGACLPVKWSQSWRWVRSTAWTLHSRLRWPDADLQESTAGKQEAHATQHTSGFSIHDKKDMSTPSTRSLKLKRAYQKCIFLSFVIPQFGCSVCGDSKWGRSWPEVAEILTLITNTGHLTLLVEVRTNLVVTAFIGLFNMPKGGTSCRKTQIQRFTIILFLRFFFYELSLARLAIRLEIVSYPGHGSSDV